MTAMMSRGCNDHLISRVAVKIPRQTARIGSDLWSKIQKSHTGIGECSMEPLVSRQRQPETTSLRQNGRVWNRTGMAWALRLLRLDKCPQGPNPPEPARPILPRFRKDLVITKDGTERRKAIDVSQVPW